MRTYFTSTFVLLGFLLTEPALAAPHHIGSPHRAGARPEAALSMCHSSQQHHSSTIRDHKSVCHRQETRRSNSPTDWTLIIPDKISVTPLSALTSGHLH